MKAAALAAEGGDMEIQLQRAELVWSSTTVGWCEGIKVVIDVENLGYHKDVIVHFANGYERRARYLQSLPYNRELWIFSSDAHDPEGSVVGGKGFGPVKFCLRYTVNGRTYWDNNCGWDYCLTWQEPVAPAVWQATIQN